MSARTNSIEGLLFGGARTMLAMVKGGALSVAILAVLFLIAVRLRYGCSHGALGTAAEPFVLLRC
jgi:hypothetical protein